VVSPPAVTLLGAALRAEVTTVAKHRRLKAIHVAKVAGYAVVYSRLYDIDIVVGIPVLVVATVARGRSITIVIVTALVVINFSHDGHWTSERVWLGV